MPRILRIDHIAIVVRDADAALAFWRDALGLPLSHVEDVPDQEAAVAFLPLGGSEVELVKPITETSGVARYLKKHGPGMHHICFQVDHIDETLEVLERRGVRLINEVPKIGTAGKKIAFVHPESTHGVLVELYEVTPQEAERRKAISRGLVERARTESQVMSAGVMAFLRTLVRNEDEFESRQPDGAQPRSKD